MSAESRTSVNQDMGTGDVGRSRRRKEEGKTSNIRRLSISTRRLVLAQCLVSVTKAKRSHLRGEETWADSVDGDVALHELDGKR